jgi:hypothetical protein
MLRLPGFVAFAFFLTTACDRTRQAEGPEHTASATSIAYVRRADDTVKSVLRGVADGSVWHQRIRELDVTGDGRVDTLLLRAVGPVVDSLAIGLWVVTSGDYRG